MAAGVLNYPRFDWRFVGGDVHTVLAGYKEDGTRKSSRTSCSSRA
jgi:hypothetical protein